MATFGATFFGIKYFRRWSIEKKILDVPNERSSHERPVPRGGGLVFVTIILAAYIIFQIVYAEVQIRSYIVGAILIALISWLDDIFSISFIWRLFFHILAATVFILEVGYWESVYLPFFGIVELGYAGFVLTILWIVGLTNAYNFMDGIDGIAGVQALTAAFGWTLTGRLLGIEFFEFYGLVMISSITAFLIYNWQPAKIFMGDVGSSFLGYTFAVFPLLTPSEQIPHPYGSYLPLLAVLFVWLFLFDTLQTLFRRFFKGEKLWEAHRQHIYQMLIIEGQTHSFVSVFYGILSAVIGSTAILFVVVSKNDGWLLICVAAATFVLLLKVFSKFLLTKRN